MLENIEEGCRECYTDNWRAYICTCQQLRGTALDIYNHRLSEDGADVEEKVRYVFQKQRNASKINVAFGFILKNEETGEVRYYYPSQNGFLFDAPFLIANDADLETFVETLKQEDWAEYLRQQKPNSKWSIGMLTNTAIYVYKIKDQPIGAVGDALPRLLTYNRELDALEKKSLHQSALRGSSMLFPLFSESSGFRLEEP